MPSISQTVRIKWENGDLAGLARSAIPFGIQSVLGMLPDIVGRTYQSRIRPKFPKTSYVTRNGIKIKRARLFDRYIPPSWHSLPTVHADYKSGNSDLIEATASLGDDVVVIGGGYGVTAVYAAEAVGPDGSVDIYEASEEQVHIINQAIELQHVSEISTVYHALVGENINVYEGIGEPIVVSSADLPDCDLLEMDCEGAELEILKSMSIRPEKVIIELHPHLYDGPSDAVLTTLTDLGYAIQTAVDQYGRVLSEEELSKLVHFDREQGKVTDWGAIHPPVVQATRDR